MGRTAARPGSGHGAQRPGSLAVAGMGCLKKCLNLPGIFLEIFWRFTKTALFRRFSLRLVEVAACGRLYGLRPVRLCPSPVLRFATLSPLRGARVTTATARTSAPG